jgi:hypothetical protein
MSVSYHLLLTDNVRRPRSSALGPGVDTSDGYEPEHSERQVTGSVELGPATRWYATLAVSMTGEQSSLVTIERTGPTPPGAPDVSDVALVIPPGEADAVVVLLRGLVAHARRDGVLGA